MSERERKLFPAHLCLPGCNFGSGRAGGGGGGCANAVADPLAGLSKVRQWADWVRGVGS